VVAIDKLMNSNEVHQRMQQIDELKVMGHMLHIVVLSPKLCNQFLKSPKVALFNAKSLHSSTLTCALMTRANVSKTLDEITYVAPTLQNSN
jgi:hypothetical protein